MTVAPSLTIRGSGASWAVYDDVGKRLSGWHTQRYKAEDTKTRLEREHTITKRSCLCCRKHFESEGPHNRLCNTCRRETEGLI